MRAVGAGDVGQGVGSRAGPRRVWILLYDPVVVKRRGLPVLDALIEPCCGEGSLHDGRVNPLEDIMHVGAFGGGWVLPGILPEPLLGVDQRRVVVGLAPVLGVGGAGGLQHGVPGPRAIGKQFEVVVVGLGGLDEPAAGVVVVCGPKGGLFGDDSSLS